MAYPFTPLSQLKADYWTAIRQARNLDLPVKGDPMVSLACEGNRQDLNYVQGRLNNVMSLIHEEIVRRAGDENPPLPQALEWELVPYWFAPVLRRHHPDKQ